MEILNLLNKQFNNKYDFLRVLKVEYNTLFKIAEIWFLYPENVPDLTNDDKKEISEYLDGVLQLSAKTNYKFKRSFLEERVIKKTFIEFLKNTYQSVFSYKIDDYISISINNDEVTINILINSLTSKYFESNNVVETCVKYMQKMFIGRFVVVPKIDNSITLNSDIIVEREKEFYDNLPPPQKIERYEVFEPVKLFGDDITPMPEFLRNQTKERESVILSGKVSMLKEGTYISKRNKKKGSEEKSFYYSFVITDHTGKIPAIYFSSKTNLPKIRTIKDGDSVLVVGDIKRGIKDLTVHIKSLSLCEIIEPKLEEKKQEEVVVDQLKSPQHIEAYSLIKPEEFEWAKQSNLFEKPRYYNSDFLSKKFVVFDVETTGLDPERCEIIEIGSVKIENGKITQKFQTLLKPSHEISDEITNLTGITNEMVEDAPLGTDVVFDFYKFCEGCILVGYNVSFDHAFLQNLAKRVGLIFPNETLDAMVLAKQKLYLPKYKLINVVEALGLELNNAHRAYADALATAEVLQKLNEIE